MRKTTPYFSQIFFRCTVHSVVYLTLILLTWKIWWANNASRWQMGFTLASEGLGTPTHMCVCAYIYMYIYIYYLRSLKFMRVCIYIYYLRSLKFMRVCIYTGCPRRNLPDFGRVFLMLNSTDITQNIYIRSWTVTEIMAREKCGLLAGSTYCTWPAVPSALPDMHNQGRVCVVAPTMRLEGNAVARARIDVHEQQSAVSWESCAI